MRCAERGVPWGISESAYNLRDRSGTYHYRAFGVPDLALKRGLAKDLVVAPYATCLAMHVDPHAALRNATALEAVRRPCAYGSVMRSTGRGPRGIALRRAVVDGSPAGMSLASLTNVLTQMGWQAALSSRSMVRAAELLLFERIPRRFGWQRPAAASRGRAYRGRIERPAVARVRLTPHAPAAHRPPWPTRRMRSWSPRRVRVSRASGLRSRDGETTGRAITTANSVISRYRSGRTWSVAHQPLGAPADTYSAVFALDRVIFHRQDGDLETTTAIAVPDALARRFAGHRTNDRVRTARSSSRVIPRS